MKSGHYTRELSYICTVPHGTAANAIADMQAAGMFLKGKRGRGGGVDLTATCRINGLLAAALSHPRGVPLADSVREIRSLPIGAARRTHLPDESTVNGARGAFDFLRGLSIHPLDDLGAVLDSTLLDIESGRFKKWAANDRVWLTVEFGNHNLAVMFVLERPDKREGIYLAFGGENANTFNDDRGCVTRHTRIQLKAFESLGAA